MIAGKKTILVGVTGSIAAYKEAKSYAAEYDKLADALREKARELLEYSGATSIKTDFGTIGITQPKKPKLDKALWQEAISEDVDLQAVQRRFDVAKAALEEAQLEFSSLPEGSIYIK